MKNVDVNNLKGVFDYVGNDEIVRRKIREVLASNFLKYGYTPADTSLLYNYDFLAYKYDNDAEILKEMYTLKDQGNRSLALRYDLTMPFCKVICSNKNIKMPFKRYEMGKVFRNGPVKPGRNREFYQCDIDVVGIDNRFIELEQMQLVVDTFNELGIDIVIKWNNRKLMSGLLLSLDIESEKIDKCILVLDKMEKITKKEMIDEFGKIGVKEDVANAILDIFSLSLDEYNNKFLFADNELIKEGLQEINEINDGIKRLELSDNTLFCPTLARGLSIYTGIVFEFFDKMGRLSCSLGGGGRYNSIITNFINDGNSYPAVGLSFGLEPIYTILKDSLKSVGSKQLYIISMDTEMECLSLGRKFRKCGINTVIELNGKRVKKCFEYASKEGFLYVLVVGSDEVKSGLYSLKNMKTGVQENLSCEDIIVKLSNNLL